ncbi:hypothetical protein N7510_006580 [Penicillium lagena]|uniref:uncharacterized protein n=1 Tax=Penicillium lagena TaxID=94218 RepID=UPI0025419618|nr:uncharacterized protein N7510_006580 [Penicillium lagena]KAJ5613386.1 hypothetical protein N7510_006580 [Penicillium lagena]
MFERARRGERLTDEEIRFLTNKSTELAGVGSTAGKSALNQDQVQWATTSDQVLSKPVDEINRQVARESRAFEMVPATGSVSSHVQSVAERNESRRD